MDLQLREEDIRGQTPEDIHSRLEQSNNTLDALWTSMQTCYTVDGFISSHMMDLLSEQIAKNARLIGYIGIRVAPDEGPFGI